MTSELVVIVRHIHKIITIKSCKATEPEGQNYEPILDVINGCNLSITQLISARILANKHFQSPNNWFSKKGYHFMNS